MVDFFIVNVALPTIGRDLHASAPLLELVVSAYASAYALLLVVGGRLGDAFGRKRLFLAGMAAFTLTSLACGLAPTAPLLVAARAAQGASAALMVPQVLSTIQAATHGAAPRPGAGPVRRHRRPRRRRRPAARRPARLGQHRRHRLAADLPGQRPDRRRGPDPGPAARAREPVPARRPRRLPRHRPARRDRPGAAHPADRGPVPALAGLDDRAAGGGPAGPGRLRRGRDRDRAPRPRPAGPAVAAAAPQHAQRAGPGAAVLRRIRRLHVQLRAAGPAGPARQRAGRRGRAGADGRGLPARLAVHLPAAAPVRRPGCSPPGRIGQVAGLVILGGHRPGRRGRTSRCWPWRPAWPWPGWGRAWS